MSTPVKSTSSKENSTPVQTNFLRLQKRQLSKEIKTILLRFKFNILITDIIVGIFDLEPTDVKEKLNELRLPCNKESIARLLTSRCLAFSIQDLEDKYHTLLLYRTAFSGKLKTWITLSLLEPAEDHSFETDLNVIKVNILQGLRIKGLNAIVKVITHEELVWIMIIEKKLTRKRGIKLTTPVFICYEIGLPYLFTASKLTNVLMESILRAMKFKKHKQKQLVGKDIKSLLALLKNRAVNGNTQTIPFTDEVNEVVVGHRFVDLSERKKRENYVKHVFDTKDPVTLDSFTVHADAVWKSDLVPEMKGEPFPVTMTLKSKDVVGMIKHMASTNIVTVPLPEYLQTIVRSAKNKVRMKTVDQN